MTTVLRYASSVIAQMYLGLQSDGFYAGPKDVEVCAELVCDHIGIETGNDEEGELFAVDGDIPHGILVQFYTSKPDVDAGSTMFEMDTFIGVDEETRICFKGISRHHLMSATNRFLLGLYRDESARYLVVTPDF